MKLHRDISVYVACVLLLAMSLLLATQATSYRNKHETSDRRLKQINSLLSTYQHKPYGYACGVLDVELASEIIGSEAELQPTSGQRTYTFGAGKDDSAWLDSCVYENKTTSAEYVELHITTFLDEELAREQLLELIPVVNDKEVLLDTQDSLVVYDAGVVYSVSGRRTVQVSTSTGALVDLRSRAIDAYNLLEDKLELL